jgi:hypothetical protein
MGLIFGFIAVIWILCYFSAKADEDNTFDDETEAYIAARRKAIRKANRDKGRG